MIVCFGLVPPFHQTPQQTDSCRSAALWRWAGPTDNQKPRLGPSWPERSQVAQSVTPERTTPKLTTLLIQSHRFLFTWITESFLLHTLKMFRFTLLDPPWPFCFVLFPHCIFIMWLWQRDPIGSFDAVTHTLMLTQSVAQEVQEKTYRTRRPAGGPAAVIIINN